jgi:hypothetical protein
MIVAVLRCLKRHRLVPLQAKKLSFDRANGCDTTDYERS